MGKASHTGKKLQGKINALESCPKLGAQTLAIGMYGWYQQLVSIKIFNICILPKAGIQVSAHTTSINGTFIDELDAKWVFTLYLFQAFHIHIQDITVYSGPLYTPFHV